MVSIRDGTEGEACIHDGRWHDNDPSTISRYQTDNQIPPGRESEVLQVLYTFPFAKQGVNQEYRVNY
jgi:hypothetical protein